MSSALTIEAIEAAKDDLQQLRRDIHAHPELCFEEHRTSDLVAGALARMGVEVHRGIGRTGLVGVIRKGSSLRAIGLRADMDALPITEENNFPHASIYPGKMHACGHDGHTVMLLAAAEYLARHGRFDGTVYLIFQPAEEGGGGARAMIGDGLFQRFPMDAIFGAHNIPGLKVGQFAVSPGPVTAANSNFAITVRGKGGHAALPDLSIDPILPACQIVQTIQTIVSRNKPSAEQAVISITMIHGGEAPNAIPDSCEIQGTVRTFEPDVSDLVERRMREIALATSAAFGAECDFRLERQYPPTINDPVQTAFVRDVLIRHAGGDDVAELETMGSEDFSYFLLEKPGCFFAIGNGSDDHRPTGAAPGPCLLHNPAYDFNDALIPVGGSIWVHLVEAWFEQFALPSTSGDANAPSAPDPSGEGGTKSVR